MNLTPKITKNEDGTFTVISKNNKATISGADVVVHFKGQLKTAKEWYQLSKMTDA